LHLGGFFRGQVLKELTDANLDPLLARIHHMVGQMTKEYVILLFLVFRTEKVPDSRSVYIVQQDQQVVEDFD